MSNILSKAQEEFYERKVNCGSIGCNWSCIAATFVCPFIDFSLFCFLSKACRSSSLRPCSAFGCSRRIFRVFRLRWNDVAPNQSSWYFDSIMFHSLSSSLNLWILFHFFALQTLVDILSFGPVSFPFRMPTAVSSTSTGTCHWFGVIHRFSIYKVSQIYSLFFVSVTR